MALLSAGATVAQAQVTQLTINRSTECDNWVELWGSDGTCTVTHTTGPMLLSGMAGSMPGLSTANFTWTGGPPANPTHFVAAKIYSGDPNSDCGSNFIIVGVSSCSYLSHDDIYYYDVDCQDCGGGERGVDWNGISDGVLEL